MELSTVLRPFFAIAICGIIYFIIIFALKVMYKDIKNGDKRQALKQTWGLEILSDVPNSTLKKGGVIPIRGVLTLGRKENNELILNDQYVSGHHAKIYIKNSDYFIEDLKSTNGTLLNDYKLEGKSRLNLGDEIKIGNIIFKVIG